MLTAFFFLSTFWVFFVYNIIPNLFKCLFPSVFSSVDLNLDLNIHRLKIPSTLTLIYFKYTSLLHVSKGMLCTVIYVSQVSHAHCRFQPISPLPSSEGSLSHLKSCLMVIGLQIHSTSEAADGRVVSIVSNVPLLDCTENTMMKTGLHLSRIVFIKCSSVQA